MSEEFDESEVVFSDNISSSSSSFDNFDDNSFYICNNSRQRRNGSKTKKKKRSVSASVPVNIPGNGFELADSGEVEEEEEYGGGGGIVPPHVVIGRRIQRKMAFSVCTGNGRTLKGRDLSQVRNSILRLTGFLEA